mgnify:CR=1 FL=1
MSGETEYWFARRHPPGDKRNSFAPVNRMGYIATAIYVVVLLIGGVAFAWIGASGYLLQGALVFAAVAMIAGGSFIAIANAKGDKTRTIADYRKAPPRV